MKKINLILLSGGSGKRLWPLSNGVRSKQFLKLLKSPDGKYESMVQRVMRQINEAGLDATITIATSVSQADSIKSQLGNTVEVVTEPERRDTFPAIALATSYLLTEKNAKADDIAVVLPIDQYTEISYFKTVAKMADAVESNVANLVLMGICPTEPSSKYGYIIPAEKDKEIMQVSRFTEKPTEDKAKELLQLGALWNGGVFAFKLGYIKNIVEKYSAIESFSQVRNNYCAFPKISFDYEVVEKENSIAVVPFSGQWKDLGTWNALVEETDASIGKVVVDENVKNTNVINELDIPVVCMGLEDVVVAASHDGIFVGKKASSEKLKSYIDNIEMRPMFEERRWGEYTVLNINEYPDGKKSLTKLLKFNDGHGISYQRHKKRSEVWTVVSGTGLLTLDDVVSEVKQGDVILIKEYQKHAIKSVENLQIVEVQLGTELTEEDIERF